MVIFLDERGGVPGFPRGSRGSRFGSLPIGGRVGHAARHVRWWASADKRHFHGPNVEGRVLGFLSQRHEGTERKGTNGQESVP